MGVVAWRATTKRKVLLKQDESRWYRMVSDGLWVKKPEQKPGCLSEAGTYLLSCCRVTSKVLLFFGRLHVPAYCLGLAEGMAAAGHEHLGEPQPCPNPLCSAHWRLPGARAPRWQEVCQLLALQDSSFCFCGGQLGGCWQGRV